MKHCWCGARGREGEEVKQFVKLSCQPLHGGILLSAKMNILFLMHNHREKLFSSSVKKVDENISWSIWLYQDWRHFAKFFPWQDSIWEMGFVRERPVRVQHWRAFAKVLGGYYLTKTVLYFCISAQYFSTLELWWGLGFGKVLGRSCLTSPQTCSKLQLWRNNLRNCVHIDFYKGKPARSKTDDLL